MAIKHLKDGALDCGVWAPRKRRVKNPATGDIEIERLPSMEFWTAIDPQGHVKNVPLHPGSGKPGTAGGPGLEYKRRILDLKPKAGWVSYLECPKATGKITDIPEALQGGPPCTEAADGHPIGRDRQWNPHPCKCALAIEAARKAKNARVDASARVQRDFEEEQKRQASAQGAADIATARLANALAAAVAGKTAEPTPPPKDPKAK